MLYNCQANSDNTRPEHIGNEDKALDCLIDGHVEAQNIESFSSDVR